MHSKFSLVTSKNFLLLNKEAWLAAKKRSPLPSKKGSSGICVLLLSHSWEKKLRHSHVKRCIYNHHWFNFKLLAPQHTSHKIAVKAAACKKLLHCPMSTHSYLFMIEIMEEEQRKLHLDSLKQFFFSCKNRT